MLESDSLPYSNYKERKFMIYRCASYVESKCDKCLWGCGIEASHHPILSHYHNIHRGGDIQVRFDEKDTKDIYHPSSFINHLRCEILDSVKVRMKLEGEFKYDSKCYRPKPRR